MTGLELENFKKSDEKKYILKENKEFLLLYNCMIKAGFKPIIDIDEMQELIKQINMFFEFKYPEFMFDNLVYGYHSSEDEINSVINNIINLSKTLDFEQLKYRLNYDKRQFLDCSYEQICEIISNDNISQPHHICFFKIDFNGIIDEYDRKEIKKFIGSKEEIKTIEYLYGKLEANATNLNYDEVKEMIKRHKFNTTIRNRLLELIPIYMIYNDPYTGYYRAKSFIRMFNKEYNLDLNLKEVDRINDTDYFKPKVKNLIRE